MPAPMYSRWKRNFDKVFKQAGKSPAGFLHLKNKVQPYSISDNAAERLGEESFKADVEWFDILSNPMPHKHFMVEFSWRSYHKHLNHSEANEHERPTRAAYLFMDDSEGWGALYLVLYENGTFILAPGVLTYNRNELTTNGDMRLMGIGHPSSRVVNHMDWLMDSNLRNHQHIINMEFAGIGRQCLSAYGAVVQARLPDFRPAPLDAPQRQRKTSGKVIELNETNLYLRPRTIEGVSHYEPKDDTQPRIRHEVRGHWCYRRNRANPFECDVPSKIHDWEGNDRKQVCIHCGQRRWFKPTHERGEGELVQKIKNIRA